MKKTMDTRRSFSRKLAGIVLSVTPLNILFNSCTKQSKETESDPCNDLSELNETELAARDQLGYTAQSSFADRTCSNCSLFVKSDNTLTCGSCLAMKGPVADGGYCTVWAPVEVN